MKCPYCAFATTEVVETRDSEDLAVTRRRRSCTHCSKRFTTYERVEAVLLTVLKKDGSKEQFNREKLATGIRKATEKTSITKEHIERIVNEVERSLMQRDTTEIKSGVIGELVAQELKKLDQVAYIRFASVFKQFVDLEEFKKEIKKVNRK
jgi:transcriptional repressor NrdR